VADLPLVRDDGTPFPQDEVEALSDEFCAHDVDERIALRNENADQIARHEAARLLLVSGPGTGKSTLFKARLKHWLDEHPGENVAVATFVRKLVKDLKDDIATDTSLSAQQKSCVSVLTLHSLARSIIERNRGTKALSLKPHCLMIPPRWEVMVWADAVALRGSFTLEEHPWEQLRESLYRAEPMTEDDWAALREEHIKLQRFYNALTFADLIVFATDAIREEPKLVEGTFYIIDEFQDFNAAEEQLIRELTREARGLLLVGDDDQVLYDRLRAGDPDIIRTYYNDEPEFANGMLPFCGRCGFYICRAAEAFLKQERDEDAIEKVFVSLSSEEEAEKVRVVASTTPKSGVEYIEAFLEQHREQLEERKEAIENKTKKDSYLLILTPGRKMPFLGEEADRLRELLNVYAVPGEKLSREYWAVRDYYYAARDLSQNFTLRQVLAREGVDHEIVVELLREAMSSGRNLRDLDHAVISECIEKIEAVAAIIDGEADLPAKAVALEALGFGSAATLERDLAIRPIRGASDPGVEEAGEGLETVGAAEIQTIVGSKGLSADHVIVLGCDDVSLALTSRSAFFVAMTRARQSLTLMASMRGGGAKGLHAYVTALPDDDVEAVQVKAGGKEVEFPSIEALQDQLERMAHFATRRPKR
jgi:superfamily I DNA/RNA helicase